MSIIKMTNEEVYNNYYVKLPRIIATIWGVVFGLAATLDVLLSTGLLKYSYSGILSFLVGEQAYVSAIFAVIFWAIIVFLLTRGIHIILKIVFSQKMMVVERLTQIKDK